MTTGTKSVLYGAHCFFIHPWFVAWAWWKLYGFPWHPMLWVAFFVHDLGYIGKKYMDDEEGERHPELGALICGFIAGFFYLTFWKPWASRREHYIVANCWHDFCLLHSRFYCKKLGLAPSRLCYADKLSITLEPEWLYLPRVRATGEIKEYMGEPKYASMNLSTNSEVQWFRDVQEYLRRWVAEHADGKEDTWTPSVTAKNS